MPKIVIKELHVLWGFEADDDAEYAVVAALEIESALLIFLLSSQLRIAFIVSPSFVSAGYRTLVQ